MDGQMLGKKSLSGLSYLLYLPPGYDQGKEIPLLLFLHGSGERGNDLELLKKYGPPAIAAKEDFPCIILAPQCPRNDHWHSEQLDELLEEVLEEVNADRNSVYVSGVSMGGYGCWELAMYVPEKFAAVVPVCGGGNPDQVHRLKPVPVWAFHGAKDEIVPLDASRLMVEGLNRAGGNVRFTIYPDAGHDSWTSAYGEKELYRWMFESKKMT